MYISKYIILIVCVYIFFGWELFGAFSLRLGKIEFTIQGSQLRLA